MALAKDALTPGRGRTWRIEQYAWDAPPFSFGDPTNPQDLAGYDVLVLCEPNVLATPRRPTTAPARAPSTPGWDRAAGGVANHVLFLNATDWLADAGAVAPPPPPPVAPPNELVEIHFDAGAEP